MKFTKAISAIAAAALAVSAMAVSASALDAQIGNTGDTAIVFVSSDWLAQYWLDGAEWASIPTNATITGNGQYTVSIEAKAKVEDEETGEEVVVDGATGIAFAALQVKDGETAFPGMVLTIDSVKFDGADAELSGTPYTSSDDGETTRVNLYNSWVSELPEDARTIDGLAADATAIPLVTIGNAWNTMEVTFTVSGIADAAPADDAAAEDTAAVEDAAAAEDTAAADDTAAVEDAAAAEETVAVEETVAAPADDKTSNDKTNSDTGVEGVAVVAGLAVLAVGAVIVAKKRK